MFKTSRVNAHLIFVNVFSKSEAWNIVKLSCCCCLPCDHVVASGYLRGGGVEVILPYGNKLRSTHCRLFLSDTDPFTSLEP